MNKYKEIIDMTAEDRRQIHEFAMKRSKEILGETFELIRYRGSDGEPVYIARMANGNESKLVKKVVYGIDEDERVYLLEMTDI